MGTFDGRVVLITGASSGIGAVTAVQFAEDGASLALGGRNEERLEEVAKECLSKGLSEDKVLTIKADLAKEEDVQRTMDMIIKHFGRLDVLVNNAGVVDATSILGEDLMKTYDRIMSINIRSVLQLSKLAIPHLIATKGAIVNISSIVGKRVCPGFMAYNMSKCALDHFTRVTALELAPKGVRINAVNPGVIITPMLDVFPVSTEEVREIAAKDHPLGRAGECDDVAPVIKFLASKAASFITGETISIDGGRHALCPCTLVSPSIVEDRG
ncbi:3-oxoacyl-[acyl-carrier-protein] reductase FabG-like [Diadema antillarum]|uniref:3-oxoacyl-[acyl-carrier-protein] reductase FabG-like n=1 Tax=Diadema antillarum TaxID=105358 RepID=UPI003A8743D6